MNDTNNKQIIKNKTEKLMELLLSLDTEIAQKINSRKEKNNSIDLDYIAKYKTEKNKEIAIFKKDLNSLIEEVDIIINNITK